MATRTARFFALLISALALVGLACAMVLSIINGTLGRESISLVAVVSATVVGGIIAFHRPTNLVGWLCLGSAVSFVLQELTSEYAAYGLVTQPGSLPFAQAMAWPQTWLWVPGVMLPVTLLLLYFPDGRLVSPRWRPIVWLAAMSMVAIATISALSLPKADRIAGIDNPLALEVPGSIIDVLAQAILVLAVAPVFLSIVSLVIRFRRSRPNERQQLKWLIYTAGMMLVLLLLPSGPVGSVLFMVKDTLTGLVFACIPVAIGIAVLKYRLYDIDVIINRTLVYGVLTAILALLYVGSVMLLQGLISVFTGQAVSFFTGQADLPPIVIVASTLVIAALFNPLRRRIQAIIDQRFYRRKYDAEKTLQAFSMRLRDETDVNQLSAEIVQVVQETLQPAHVSVWLHEPKHEVQRWTIRRSALRGSAS